MADFRIKHLPLGGWELDCYRCHTVELFESHFWAVRGMDTHAIWFHMDTDWFDKVLKEERDHHPGRGPVLGEGSGAPVQLPGP